MLWWKNVFESKGLLFLKEEIFQQKAKEMKLTGPVDEFYKNKKCLYFFYLLILLIVTNILKIIISIFIKKDVNNVNLLEDLELLVSLN